MNQTKHFAGKTALVVGVSMLLGVSAFAESRHRNETRGSGGGDRSTRERSDRGSSHGGDSATPRREQHIDRGSQSRGDWQHTDRGTSVQPDRGQIQRDRTERGDRSGTWNRDNNDRSTRNTSRNRDSNDTWNRNNNDRNNRNETWNRGNNDRSNRGNNRNDSWNRNDSRSRSNGDWNRNGSRGSYQHGRQSFRGRGQVSRYQRYGNGYHVWISGCDYPFYVPLAYYSSHRIRVGLALDLFGYYNPLGYYDYYDPGYSSYGNVRSEFRGVVEEVDYRRDRLVVRNNDSGNFVTVNLSNRRFEDVREGDYVVIEGEWTRSNLFVAYDVRLIDNDRYDDYDQR